MHVIIAFACTQLQVIQPLLKSIIQSFAAGGFSTTQSTSRVGGGTLAFNVTLTSMSLGEERQKYDLYAHRTRLTSYLTNYVVITVVLAVVWLIVGVAVYCCVKIKQQLHRQRKHWLCVYG